MNELLVIPRRVDSRVRSSFSFIFLFFFLKFRLKLIRFVLCSSPLFKNRPCRSSCASAMTSNRLSFSPPRASLIKPQPFSLCSHCSVEHAHALQHMYTCPHVLHFTASKQIRTHVHMHVCIYDTILRFESPFVTFFQRKNNTKEPRIGRRVAFVLFQVSD